MAPQSTEILHIPAKKKGAKVISYGVRVSVVPVQPGQRQAFRDGLMEMAAAGKRLREGGAA